MDRPLFVAAATARLSNGLGGHCAVSLRPLLAASRNSRQSSAAMGVRCQGILPGGEIPGGSWVDVDSASNMSLCLSNFMP